MLQGVPIGPPHTISAKIAIRGSSHCCWSRTCAYSGGVGEVRKFGNKRWRRSKGSSSSIFFRRGVKFSKICVIKKIKESGNAMCVKSFFFTAARVLKFEVWTAKKFPTSLSFPAIVSPHAYLTLFSKPFFLGSL